ncbi:hypothetical protein ACIBG0_42100 [Nocardia sp. NPDC050630]|uniref:hypothetical protein n=1 Tax=Nocardia sp. NPDC050630 TaxID=3364321 RepID=UPI0037A65AF4
MPDSAEYWGGHRMASSQDMAERAELADRVVAQLQFAGLPAYIASHETWDMVGAAVTFDKLHATEGGGISVEWRPDQRLVRAGFGLDPDSELDITAVDAAERLRLAETPAAKQAIRHHLEIDRNMQSAIIGILTSAGLRAYNPDNDYAPSEIAAESP